MISRTRHHRSAVRLALGALVATLVLPGLSVASHTVDCNVRTPAPVCVDFSPAMAYDIPFPYADSASTIVWRQAQGDHEFAVTEVTHTLPKGWQFNVENVKAASVGTTTTPATDCTQIYDSSTPKKSVGAEVLSSALFAWYKTGTGATRSDAKYGGGSSAGSGLLSFLKWNAGTQTADLCMYLRGVSGAPTGASEFILPVTLQRLPATDPNGWRIFIDWKPVVKNTGMNDAAASLINQTFFFYGMSAGNYNRDASGALRPVAFHRLPAATGNYTLTTTFRGCTGSTDPADATACKNGSTQTKTASQLVQITPPPAPGSYDFGRFTAPVDGVGLKTFSTYWTLNYGNTTVPITWTQPTVGAGKAITAYELQVKLAGDSTDKHYTRINKLGACGADGSDANCLYNLSFPLNAGSSVFSTDGHYQLRLITIYSDGKRTDGRCDDGSTGGGILCDPNEPQAKIVLHGYAEKFILSRSRAWPTGFNIGTAPGNCCSSKPPKYILFVDYGTKEVELITWRVYGPELSRRYHSNLIRNEGTNSILYFGDAQWGGTPERFHFIGYTNPNLSGQIITYSMRGFPESCKIPQPPSIDPKCSGTPTMPANEAVSGNRF